MYSLPEEDLKILIDNQNRHFSRLSEGVLKTYDKLLEVDKAVRYVFTELSIPDNIKIFALKTARDSWSYETDSIMSAEVAYKEDSPIYTFRLRPYSFGVPDKEGKIFSIKGSLESKNLIEELKTGLESILTELSNRSSDINVRVGVILPFLAERGLVNKAWMAKLPLKVIWYGDYFLITDYQLKNWRAVTS
jgi:hypothetical protein